MNSIKYLMWVTGWVLCVGAVSTLDVDPNASIGTELLVVSIGIFMLAVGCLIDISQLERKGNRRG
nr:MAG TPA: hypothetical protein [Caudoviricetes sp.]